MKRLQNGEPKVSQHRIGNLILSYNPDDNRFHVSKPDYETIATFANNSKGYANALYWIRKKEASYD